MATIPTVPEDVHSLESQSYYSPIPEALKNVAQGDHIILGVDEAGRGPVLGPMVYGVAYCTKSYQDSVVKSYGFDDSKKLTDPIRRRLFEKIYNGDIDGIGYATTSITPFDISTGMLRYPPEQNYNLNEQAHDVTIGLIQKVLDAGVNISHIYVDTVGPPITYQDKLEKRFPVCKFTVAKKADSLYPVVSVASVIAKVTRDVWLEQLRTIPDEILGSGYPGDPKTVKWLNENIRPLFGWNPEIVRFSWQTCQNILETNPHAINIEWEEESLKKRTYKLKPASIDPQKNSPSQPDVGNIISMDAWFGH
ncbi:ribonuclease H2 catalytic subunit RNH201 Ecym_5390 [Eremothecium cymbalariae DBVPG|uniref:Ribonuclease n=1 Tax=Eremothecium cymbalariae (strain CBS 270.75 / DBVPG 7215 / KCTC 17166 / NRRL Y-17582) TaxID=931890 RepID=I6NDK3_ERECY|nr:hypothetical protein Ecym_5390 [Eremothecium cymbalariae DBVPG\